MDDGPLGICGRPGARTLRWSAWRQEFAGADRARARRRRDPEGLAGGCELAIRRVSTIRKRPGWAGHRDYSLGASIAKYKNISRGGIGLSTCDILGSKQASGPSARDTR